MSCVPFVFPREPPHFSTSHGLSCTLQENDPDGPELSDWEKYAAEEYDFLVTEEVAGDPWDDG